MNKFILLTITILTLSFSSMAYSSFPLNDAQCDDLIRLTYRDYKARGNATIYNTQVCLSIAGYFNHGGKFTTYYGPVTEQAAIAYINDRNNPKPATVNTPVKVNNEADTVKSNDEKAKQEAIRLELEKKQKEAEAASLNEKSAEANPNAVTEQLDPTKASPNSNLSGQNSTPVNEVATIDRQPQTADRIIINSIYFLVALPFILFALSVIMAFFKVFRKKKENIEY
jgi:hypothetical protein